MRILLASSAGMGHIYPAVPLARAARQAGHEVRFAVPDEAVPTVQAFGFPVVPIPYGDPADIGRAWANLPDSDLNTYVVAEIFTRIQGLAALPAQQAAIAEFGADLVISGEASAHVAAEAGGVPSAFLGITALDLADLKWPPVVAAGNDLRAAAGLPPSPQRPYEVGVRYLSPVPPLLWNDPSLWPPGGIWYRHEDAEESPSTADAEAEASRGSRPRIYATLGSMAGGNDFGRPVFAAMLEALGRLDADVLFTLGPFDPAGLGAVPDNVTVAAYVPHAQALRCDAAIVHGGSGTTVAALARGIPLVAVPMFADQMHNADRLVAHGLGLRVDPAQVADGLAPAVDAVLTDHRYRANTERLAEEIAARPTPAEVIDQLVRLTLR